MPHMSCATAFRVARCGMLENTAGTRWAVAGQQALGRPRHRFLSSAGVACQAAAAPAETAIKPEAQTEGNEPTRSGSFPFTEIERKWQGYWEEHKTFRTPDIRDVDTTKPKFDALDMFPYPRCTAGGGRRAVGGGLMGSRPAGGRLFSLVG